MNVLLVGRTFAVVLLIAAFVLTLCLGSILAIDEFYEFSMKYPRKIQARVEQKKLRSLKEDEALADYWTEFKPGSGFNNTGEIVNRFYWNEMEKEVTPHGSGSNR